MSVPLRASAAVFVLATACALSAHGVRADDAERVLRVCADPNNLPYQTKRLKASRTALPKRWQAICTPKLNTRGGRSGAVSCATLCRPTSAMLFSACRPATN